MGVSGESSIRVVHQIIHFLFFLLGAVITGFHYHLVIQLLHAIQVLESVVVLFVFQEYLIFVIEMLLTDEFLLLLVGHILYRRVMGIINKVSLLEFIFGL